VVLQAFPATAHHAERLGGVFGDLLRQVLDAILSSMPGLLMVVLIVLIAQGVAEANKALFRAAAQGRVRLPGVHEETAGATRRIVSVLIWAFALVAMYPYLPGSDSEVFKGISVLLGAMLTLGSSGLVTQLMSGLVLIYARALRTGDYVVIGDTEGVVTEIGALATKIMTMRNQEVTIPNNQMVSQSIVNYSKLAASQGTMISTKVTIGYDAPWRQVHAMLLTAAAATPGVRADPAPRVLQRALSDWYVEYELFCHIDRPLDRLPLLSALHARVQDTFNENGVQIMSPHFVMQPEQAVVVPRSRWHEKPASPPAPGESSAPAGPPAS
jgi:small-conductance mechanosensitive channel